MAGAEVHRSALRTAGDVASQLGPPEADSARHAGVKELALWFDQEQRATCVSVDHTRLLSARCREDSLTRPDAGGVWEAGGRQAQSVTCGSRDLTLEPPAIADRRSGGSVLRTFSGFTPSHRRDGFAAVMSARLHGHVADLGARAADAGAPARRTC